MFTLFKFAIFCVGPGSKFSYDWLAMDSTCRVQRPTVVGHLGGNAHLCHPCYIWVVFWQEGAVEKYYISSKTRPVPLLHLNWKDWKKIECMASTVWVEAAGVGDGDDAEIARNCAGLGRGNGAGDAVTSLGGGTPKRTGDEWLNTTPWDSPFSSCFTAVKWDNGLSW